MRARTGTAATPFAAFSPMEARAMADDANRMPVTDPYTWNLWHVVSALEDLPVGKTKETRLFGIPINLKRTTEQAISVARCDDGATCPVLSRYGYVWTSLGAPNRELFAIPEFDEADRRNLHAATIGVHSSAPRT